MEQKTEKKKTKTAMESNACRIPTFVHIVRYLLFIFEMHTKYREQRDMKRPQTNNVINSSSGIKCAPTLSPPRLYIYLFIYGSYNTYNSITEDVFSYLYLIFEPEL